MDILHLKQEEIERMSLEEQYDALVYCTTTYTLRRVDLPYREPKKKKGLGKKQKPNTKRYTFQNDLIEDYIAREAIRDFQGGKSIPKQSYVPMFRGGKKR